MKFQRDVPTLVMVLMIFLLLPVPIAFSGTEDSPAKRDSSIRFSRLTTESGLSNDNVQGIVQDDLGFMWFATLDGLNRYDGYDFKVFRHDPDDPLSLSGNQLRKLYRDKSGYLWVATWSDGLNKYLPETETFLHYQHDPDNPDSLSHNAISGMLEDRAGVFWIGTRGGGLNRFDPATGKFTHYRHNPDDPSSLSHDFVMAVLEDRRGDLWVSTYGGLNKLNIASGTFTRYRHDPASPHSLSNNATFGLYEDHAGVLWIASENGLNRFNHQTETFSSYKHDPDNPVSMGCNFIASVLEDRLDNFWVFTYGCGLNHFDRENETFTRFEHDPADPASMGHNKIFTSYLDREGNLWMGTYGGGVTYLDNNAKNFRPYQHIPEDSTSLSHNAINGIYKGRSGKIWIGTDYGLNHFDQKKGTFKRYYHDSNDPRSLSYDSVLAIYEDQTGTIWVGTEDGLNRFNRETETFTRYHHDPQDPQSLGGDQVYSILEDRSGKLWFGTWTEGLDMFDRETGTFSHFQHQPDNPESISHNGIVALHEDSSGVLWVGTYGGGLNRFNRESSTFQRYQHDPDDPGSLSNNLVFSIYEDKTGSLWFATGGGLNKLDSKQERFTHYTVKDGLPNDVVYGILGDNRANLWLSTNQGLSRFNPRSEEFKNYDKSDGLQGNQFNLAASGQSDDGLMVFGGPSGLTVFYPEQVTDNPSPPPVVITNFLLANQPVSPGDESPLKKSILETEHLTLSYLDQVFSFEFTALNYQSSNKNRYRYTMEGFTKKWTEVGSDRRFVTYTNLDPGEYIFRVTGANNDGVWNDEGDSLKVTIIPPWWTAWWAYVLYFGMITFLILSLMQYRTIALRRKREELEQLVARRTRELVALKEEAEAADQAKSLFLAHMSHELRTPLTVILGYSELLSMDSDATSDQQEKCYAINRSGTHLLNIINDVLDIAKIEAGRVDLNLASFDLRQMLQDVHKMFMNRARSEGLYFNLQVAPDLTRNIKADEGKLLQILINLLGNAINYTQEGGFTLRARTQNKADDPTMVTLQLEVEDSGPGIPEEKREQIFEPFTQVKSKSGTKRGSGLGLTITRSYIELMEGEISVHSTVGEGSLFTVDLPVALSEETGLKGDETATPEIKALLPGESKRRILVVDDEVENRILLRNHLDKVGFEVQEAENGREALSLFEKWQPHFIWMDLRMPEMDGYETTARIRQLPGGETVKIVALSAHLSVELQEKLLDCGCDDSLSKPYQAHALYDIMARQLGIGYQYKETAGTAETQPDRISRTAIDNLPPELQKTLYEAASSLNDLKFIAALKQVQRIDPALAEGLAPLAREFQFDKILQLLGHNGRKHS
ncbi:MAG: two-component regulator propeller domain-containing protein [Thermodesulfobacteriota bacterium]